MPPAMAKDRHCKKGVKKPGSEQIKRRIVRESGGQSPDAAGIIDFHCNRQGDGETGGQGECGLRI